MTWACPSCGGGNPPGTRFCGHCGVGRVEGPGLVETRVDEAVGQFLADCEAEPTDPVRGVHERRLATAVFADLSGFTALADRVDPEQLVEVVDPLIARFSAIVAHYEGYIGKYAGDAVLAIFGAPISHEDDACRALLAALEMHQALEDLRPSLPAAAAHIGLHVGVNSGHVIARAFGNQIRPDYSVLGDAVNLAQRLEASAAAGETYVGETTHRLTRHRFTFGALAPLTLKGKADEVTAYLLRGEQAAGAPRPIRTSTLIGRSAELATVEPVISRFGKGRGGVVTVLGEPGVGKSRLIHELRERLGPNGVWWLETRCVSYGSSLAYWPFVELLRTVIGLPIDQDPQEAVRALAASLAIAGVPLAEPYLARLLGLPSPNAASLAELTPEALKRGLHDAITSWLRSLASMQPVLLVVEDIHWVDASSFELLREVAASTAKTRLILLLSGRPEGAAVEEAVALRAVEPARARVHLGPLGETDTTDLLESLLGEPAAPDLVTAVAGRSGGNPFFVEELVRSLIDRDALDRSATAVRIKAGWDDTTVPVTVEGVVAARIDTLDRRSAHVLQLASAIGNRIRVALLDAVTPEIDDLGSELDRLVVAGFLDRRTSDLEYSFVFHHALVQDVAYERMLRRQQRDVHGRIAEEAERLYGAGDDTIDLLARHHYLAGGGSRAALYLERAAVRARRIFANETALVHLRRAVEVVGTDPTQADRRRGLELDVAEILELMAEYDEADAIYMKIRNETGDIRAWRGLAGLRRKRGQFADALAQLEQAFTDDRLAGADVSGLWLERAWTLGAEGRRLDSIEAAEVGLQHPDVVPLTAGKLLAVLALAEATVGRVEQALVHSARADVLFTEANDLESLTSAQRAIGEIRTLAGDLEGAGNALRRGLELAERTGDAAERAACLVNLGMLELRQEHLEEAIAYDRLAVELAERIGHRAGQAISYTNLAEKLMLTRQLDEAANLAERAISLAGELGALWTLADAHLTMARIHLHRGSPAQAEDLATSSARLFREAGSAERAAEADDVADRARADVMGDTTGAA